MLQTNTKELLKEARKYIEEPDVIIDAYDMSYTWISPYHCEITGYDETEQIDEQVNTISQLPNENTERMAPEVANPYKPFKKKMILTTKTGDRKDIEVYTIVIEFNNQPYLVGKIEKVTPSP